MAIKKGNIKKTTNNLKNVLEIKKKPLINKTYQNEQKMNKPKEPIISLGLISPQNQTKLLESVSQYFNIKAASLYFYPFHLFTHNISNEHRFNNKYQIIRFYKKLEKVFEHGIIFHSLIKKDGQYLKRKVFVKELPVIDHDDYLDLIDEYKQVDPRYPTYFGNKMNGHIYSYDNPSYVDILSHYLCSRLVEDGLIPHFPLFYGAINTYFNKYTYKFNGEDEYNNFMERNNWCFQTDHYRIINKDDKNKVEIQGAPVYLMATEVMDYDFAEFIHGTNCACAKLNPGEFDKKEYENTIQSILFQTICALTMIQKKWNLIHNDLHLGNIMFKRTKQVFLNYQYKNSYYRVPTFGMIVKIIDWNRATLNFAGHEIKNKVYEIGNNCADMYFWPTTVKSAKPINLPNPSFDLGLLAFEILREDKILNEKSKIMKLLMDWLTMDDGRNVFNEIGKSDEEPGFKLYIDIAHYCHKGIPSNQLNKAIWNNFKVEKSRIPKNEKVYLVSE